MERGAARSAAVRRADALKAVGRLVLILLVALGLSPGIYWRETLPPPVTSQRIGIASLLEQGAAPVTVDAAGGLKLTGAWALTSRNRIFGSYSALLPPEDGELLAFSDRGTWLRLPLLDGARARMGTVFADSGAPKNAQDIEAATRDPGTGRIWLGLEGRNAILRMESDFSGETVVEPEGMRDWLANGGPEGLLRLRDGRFIVLAEGAWGGAGGPALLFPADPAETPASIGFRFDAGGSYSPTDLAELPDGRVLILLRNVHIGLPVGFSARLVVADPATIRAGEAWEWRELAKLGPGVPMDNYEGLAVSADGDSLTLWLISDDNGASYIQRTLLLRLEWDFAALKQRSGSAKRNARESLRAP